MINQRKLISIIIPCYNAEKYIGFLLKSILNQSYKYYECIIVDHSTDSSEVVIKEIVGKDSRFEILKCETNVNCSYARNIGLNHVSGDIIIFMDADDAIIDTDYFQFAVDNIKDNDFGVFQVIFSEEFPNYKFNKNDYFEQHFNNEESFWNAFFEDKKIPLIVLELAFSKFYKASLFKKLRFNSDIMLGEDDYLLLGLLNQTKKWSFYNRAFVWNRQHISSSTKTMQDKKYNVSLCECILKQIEYFKNKNNKYYKFYINVFINAFDNLDNKKSALYLIKRFKLLLTINEMPNSNGKLLYRHPRFYIFKTNLNRKKQNLKTFIKRALKKC